MDSFFKVIVFCTCVATVLSCKGTGGLEELQRSWSTNTNTSPTRNMTQETREMPLNWFKHKTLNYGGVDSSEAKDERTSGEKKRKGREKTKMASWGSFTTATV